MRRAGLLTFLLLLAAALSSSADPQRLGRTKVANAEKMISTQLASMFPDEPWFLLGQTRGVYLAGYGVVFTAEINLATGPVQTPFKQEITKEEIARHRDKKMTRLPQLRNQMMKIVKSTAVYLDALPSNEHMVLGVTLLRYPYEDPKSTPSQIVMQGERAKLMDAQRKQDPPETVIQVVEY